MAGQSITSPLGVRQYVRAKERAMKLLLTSAGIKNTSINDALVELLGKPIAESDALCIPTATYAMGGPGSAWGLSGGSMVMTPQIGEEVVSWKPPGGGDRALGVVDFAIFPHLDHPNLPENTMADAETWAAGLSVPAYAIDDQTAIKVVDGTVEVISEGHWRLFAP
jgi:hypothetical protein